MSDLTDFLLARIADDEERAQFVARQVEDNNWTPLEQWRLSWHDEYDLLCIEPSRVLAECEAKRRLVKRYRRLVERAEKFPSLTQEQAESREWLRQTVRDFAAVYADHPDYRDEWKR